MADASTPSETKPLAASATSAPDVPAAAAERAPDGAPSATVEPIPPASAVGRPSSAHVEVFSSSAAAAPSGVGSAPKSAFAGLLQSHAEARAISKDAARRATSSAVAVAGEVESNIQACVGIEISSLVQNSRHIEAAVRGLQADVKDISKRAAGYEDQYRALVSGVSQLGSLAGWLQQSESALASATASMAAVERLLTSDNA